MHVPVAKFSEVPAGYISAKKYETHKKQRPRAAVDEVEPAKAMTAPVLEVAHIQAFSDAAVDGVVHRNTSTVPLVVNECSTICLAA
jgi:hypothetical protein